MSTGAPREELACPQCLRALGSGERGLACWSCGGTFCQRSTLEALLREAERTGTARPYARPALRLDARVRYLPCPLCKQLMTRRNFGEASAVIVDVCTPHGVWFEPGELERVLEFCASGELARARAAADDRREAERKLDSFQRPLRPDVPAESRAVSIVPTLLDLLFQALF